MPLLTDTILIIKNSGAEGNFTMVMSGLNTYKLSDGYYFFDGDILQIEKFNGSKLRDHLWQNVTMRDDSSGTTGTPYGATSADDLHTKLLLLKFLRPKNPANNVNAGELISSDADNALTLGSDQLLFVPESGGSQDLQSVTDEGNTTTNPITALLYSVNDGVNERVVADETGVLQSWETRLLKSDGGAITITENTDNLSNDYIIQHANRPIGENIPVYSVNGEVADDTGNVVITELSDQITIHSPDGTTQSFTPSADTNAARGIALQAAKTAATSGDVIVVNTGIYDTYDLAKDGISYYFSEGAVVDYTGSDADSNIFTDNNTAMNFTVKGYGVFMNSAAVGSDDCVHTIHASTVFNITGKRLYSETSRAVVNENSTLNIFVEEIESYDGTIDIVGGSTPTAKTFVVAKKIKGTISFAIEHDGGDLIVYADEIETASPSFAAIGIVSGSGTCYVRCRKLVAPTLGVEHLGSETVLTVVNAQFITEGANDYYSDYAENFNVHGVYTEDYQTTLVGNGNITYLDREGNPAASDVTFTPSGTIAATNVQDAIEELDSEKQSELVSGTSIKTVGGVSLLGSGDVTEVQNTMSASTVLAPSATAVNTAMAARRFASIRFIASILSTPADNTLYYIPFTNNMAPSTSAQRPIDAPITATAADFSINIANTGTVGTAETLTIILRNNTTATSVNLTTTFTTNSANNGAAGSVAFSCTQGDDIEVWIQTPTWATNPTNLYICVDIALRN